MESEIVSQHAVRLRTFPSRSVLFSELLARCANYFVMSGFNEQELFALCPVRFISLALV